MLALATHVRHKHAHAYLAASIVETLECDGKALAPVLIVCARSRGDGEVAGRLSDGEQLNVGCCGLELIGDEENRSPSGEFSCESEGLSLVVCAESRLPIVESGQRLAR